MIILQRLSYFIFAVFVSTLFVYLLHRTFTPNDIINIPVLAIIIYLIINYSAEITYEKKLEKFLNQQSDSSISDMMENFDGAGSSLLKRLSSFSEEEEQNQYQGDQSMSLPSNQIHMEEENKISVPAPQVFQQEEETRFLPSQPEKPQQQEEETHPIMIKQENQNIPQPIQEEENKYYSIIEEKNPKEEQAMKKESKRPNVNKYLENKNHQMTNKLVRSINPININVSYNNPVAVNGFNNPDTNMNRYRFDSGLESRFGSGSGSGSGSFSGSGSCNNESSYSQSNNSPPNSMYYPSYLDNPLNKNVGGTEIPAVRQQSNYEQDRQNQILTEKNSPSPIMFGDEWSEWAPFQS